MLLMVRLKPREVKLIVDMQRVIERSPDYLTLTPLFSSLPYVIPFLATHELLHWNISAVHIRYFCPSSAPFLSIKCSIFVHQVLDKCTVHLCISYAMMWFLWGDQSPEPLVWPQPECVPRSSCLNTESRAVPIIKLTQQSSFSGLFSFEVESTCPSGCKDALE